MNRIFLIACGLLFYALPAIGQLEDEGEDDALVSRFGLRIVAAIVPLVTLIGLVALALSPTLAVLVVVQILYRGGHFSLMKPSQDMMFSIVGREAKYKTKNVVDTAVYRGADFSTSWLVNALVKLGSGTAAIAAIGAGIAAAWTATSWWVGSRFDRARLEAGESARPDAPRGSLVGRPDAEEVADHAGDVPRA